MEWISGNIFIRPNHLEKVGDSTPGHTHNFDHTTIFFSGSFLVKAKMPDGSVIERTFKAPAHALIRADVEHDIIALENNSVFWCVYSHRNPQGEISEVNTGWLHGYV